MARKVSIIIPSYNSRKWVCDAINCSLNQTCQNCEVIVVDDGSTDNTRELLQNKYGNSIKYIYQQNRGLAGARNTGLCYATGEYIQFLDADDLINSEKIEKQVNQLQGITDLSVSISDYYCCDIDDIAKKLDWHMSPCFATDNPVNELISRWERDLCIPAHCFLFDARIFKDHNILFDEKLPNHEDWDCWMRIFSLNPQIRYLDEQMAIYRIHRNSMARNRVKMREAFLKALRKQRRLFRSAPELVRLIDDKVKDVKECYKDASPALRTWNAIPRVIRSCMPWRIRKYFE